MLQEYEMSEAPVEKADQEVKMKRMGGSGDTVYSIGIIGAWVYYIGRATTTQEKVKGFLKGLVWPALLVYDVLTFLHKD
jgi:hypothetical protein